MLTALLLGDGADEGEPEPAGAPLIAPWWHTVLVTAAILGISLLGLTRRSQASLADHHLREYGASIAWEWLLLAFVLLGVWLRSRMAGIRKLFGSTRYSLLQDAGAALIFWFASTVVLGLIALLLRSTSLQSPQKVLTALAPRSSAELLLFLGLSVTAGFCEELIFRGYLLQQCTRIGTLLRPLRGGAGAPGATFGLWFGALASSLIFGAAHLYEGGGGVLAITVFGLMFAGLALRRRNLRAGIFAHAWHDALSGIALFLLTRAHAL